MALAACGAWQPSASADPSVPGPNEVVIFEFIFKPKKLMVPIGTTVAWVNRDIAAHTATRNSGSDQFDSGNLAFNKVYHHKFDQAGTYDYICFYHPGMRATIVVK